MQLEHFGSLRSHFIFKTTGRTLVIDDLIEEELIGAESAHLASVTELTSRPGGSAMDRR